MNLNYWFTATFNDANSVIKLNDKESGVIIASGYIADIAGHAGGTNSYNVSIACYQGRYQGGQDKSDLLYRPL